MFCDVEFRYPSRPDAAVLQGVNLCVKPGMVQAVVGSSGSGSATVD